MESDSILQEKIYSSWYNTNNAVFAAIRWYEAIPPPRQGSDLFTGREENLVQRDIILCSARYLRSCSILVLVLRNSFQLKCSFYFIVFIMVWTNVSDSTKVRFCNPLGVNVRCLNKNMCMSTKCIQSCKRNGDQFWPNLHHLFILTRLEHMD